MSPSTGFGGGAAQCVGPGRRALAGGGCQRGPPSGDRRQRLPQTAWQVPETFRESDSGPRAPRPATTGALPSTTRDERRSLPPRSGAAEQKR